MEVGKLILNVSKKKANMNGKFPDDLIALLDRDGHLLVHNDLATVVPDSGTIPGLHHGEGGVGFPHAQSWGTPGFRKVAFSMLQNAGGGRATFDDHEGGSELRSLLTTGLHRPRPRPAPASARSSSWISAASTRS